jgi:hypothetical protein
MVLVLIRRLKCQLKPIGLKFERLAIGKWMLDAFYHHCKSHKDIRVETSEVQSIM